MKSLSPYLIKFSGLKDGVHLFNYELGNKFFKNFDYYDFYDAKLFVKLELEKQSTLLNLKFSFHGEIEVQCDVSMENFNLELKTEHTVVVKYKDDIIKYVSYLFTSITLIISLIVLVNFNPGSHNLQLEEKVTWIANLNINYHLAIDGFSIVFILLTTITTMPTP